MHSIESSIAAEIKITQLMRGLELLEVRELNPANQVNPTQMPSMDYTYCHALTHLFEECPAYHAQQIFPDSINAAYTSPITILTPRRTTRDGGIIPIFLGVSLVISSQDNNFHINILR